MLTDPCNCVVYVCIPRWFLLLLSYFLFLACIDEHFSLPSCTLVLHLWIVGTSSLWLNVSAGFHHVCITSCFDMSISEWIELHVFVEFNKYILLCISTCVCICLQFGKVWIKYDILMNMNRSCVIVCVCAMVCVSCSNFIFIVGIFKQLHHTIRLLSNL